MSTGTADLHAITSRSEGPICNPIDARSIETQKRIDFRRPAAARQKITNTAQVSFTFFAHRPNKQYRTLDPDLLALKGTRESEQGHETTTVIGDSRRKQSLAGS